MDTTFKPNHSPLTPSILKPKRVRFHRHWLYGNDSLYTSLVKISCAPIWQQCCWQMENNPVRSHHGRQECSSVSLCWDNESGERFCFTSEDSHHSWRHCRYFQLLPLLACRQKGSQRLRHESNRCQLGFFFSPVVNIPCSNKIRVHVGSRCGALLNCFNNSIFYKTLCPDMGIVFRSQWAVDRLLEWLIYEIVLCRSDPREAEWHYEVKTCARVWPKAQTDYQEGQFGNVFDLYVIQDGCFRGTAAERRESRSEMEQGMGIKCAPILNYSRDKNSCPERSVGDYGSPSSMVQTGPGLRGCCLKQQCQPPPLQLFRLISGTIQFYLHLSASLGYAAISG